MSLTLNFTPQELADMLSSEEQRQLLEQLIQEVTTEDLYQAIPSDDELELMEKLAANHEDWADVETEGDMANVLDTRTYDFNKLAQLLDYETRRDMQLAFLQQSAGCDTDSNCEPSEVLFATIIEKLSSVEQTKLINRLLMHTEDES